MAVTITAAELANRIQIDEANALVLLPVIVDLDRGLRPATPRTRLATRRRAGAVGGWRRPRPTR